MTTLFNPPSIETERLVLTPFAAGDELLVPALYRNDPEVTRFVGWPPLDDPERARRFVDGEAKAWADGDACRGWLARERGGGAAVGAVIARKHATTAEFSYVIDKTRWRQGLGTELARAILGRARQDEELVELWAVCDVENLASAGLLEKAGFLFDRLLPEHGRHGGFDQKRDCRRFAVQLRRTKSP